MSLRDAKAAARLSAVAATVILASCGGDVGHGPAVAVACEDLVRVAVPSASIATAALVPAGTYTPAGVGAAAEPNMPSFCRITARVDPEINLEVWLPQKNWNGRFLGTGNGGFAGAIQFYPQMADAVRRGFAVAATDGGHLGNPRDASWALNNTQRLVDFGHRSLHEMTVNAKAMVSIYYGSDPNKNYYSGCSTGGRQGLMEAQRYPEDYDGIVVGAPANYMVAQQIGHTGRAFALFASADSAIPSTKIPLLAQTVLQQCDALDGISDGVLDDPRQCKPNLSVLLCTGADADTCLTQAQITAIFKLYAGTRNPRTNALIFPGYFPGGELGPGGWSFTGSFSAGPPASGTSWMKYAVFNDPNWDWHTFDFDTQADFAFTKLSDTVDATNPDLSAFQSRGGRLIQYHGWSDFAITPQVSVDYANAVRAKMGSSTDSFYRLYMAPGMQHCGGGPGPNVFGGAVLQGAPVVADPQHDLLSAVIAWVEQGQAPTSIVASRRASDGAVDRTRKLCPYPQHAVFNGSGSTDDASNFVCK